MEESCDEGGAGEGEGALTRFRETGAIRKNSTACTSHNLRTTTGPNVSVPRPAWKLRGGAATPRAMTLNRGEEQGGRGKREGEEDVRSGGGGGGTGGMEDGGKRKHVIFYMTA